jgi:cytochrome oxidase Cu insertion factor (SCO1/SenC/PrrC family)
MIKPVFALFVLLSANVALGQQPKLATAPGLDVGKAAPAFDLPNQDGEKQSLKSMLKKGKVAIVFYRSAAW